MVLWVLRHGSLVLFLVKSFYDSSTHADSIDSIDSMAARGRVKICIHAYLRFDAFMHATFPVSFFAPPLPPFGSQVAPPLALGTLGQRAPQIERPGEKRA